MQDFALGDQSFGDQLGLTAPLTIIPVRATKKITAHVYAANGTTYLRSWPDMVSDPSFSWPINGGQGSVTVDLARLPYYAGEAGDDADIDDLVEDLLVKFFVIDQESGAAGQLIYQGFIEKHEILLPASEPIKVSLVPRTATFKDVWVEGPITFTSTDPAAMLVSLKASGYLPGITLDPANPAAFGLSFTETFQRMYMRDVMEKLRRMVGAHAFWRLNPDNTLTFNEWNLRAEPDHTLKGHQYSTLRYVRSKIDVKERVFVYGADKDDDGNPLADRIFASVSVAGYDPTVRARDLSVSEPRITDAGTARSIASSRLAYARRPLIENVIAVPDSSLDPDNGYDVESFKPGQTVLALPNKVYPRSLYGTAVWGTDRWSGTFASLVQRNLVIAQVNYTPQGAVLSMTTRPSDVIEELVAVSDRQLIGAT